jgi:hypothetical protein
MARKFLEANDAVCTVVVVVDSDRLRFRPLSQGGINHLQLPADCTNITAFQTTTSILATLGLEMSPFLENKEPMEIPFCRDR